MLHHLEINVRDLASSIAFWNWLLGRLGYVEHQKWDQGISWKKDGTYLVFVQTGKDHLSANFHRAQTGLNHIAFHAGARNDVDGLVLELEKRGVKMLYADRHPHAGGSQHYAAFFEDPDRIKVELVAEELAENPKTSAKKDDGGQKRHKTA